MMTLLSRISNKRCQFTELCVITFPHSELLSHMFRETSSPGTDILPGRMSTPFEMSVATLELNLYVPRRVISSFARLTIVVLGLRPMGC